MGRIGSLLVYSLCAVLIGCQGVTQLASKSDVGKTKGTITVAVSPASASLAAGSTQIFQAVVSGSTDQGVHWAVDGVAGGSASVGTIAADGTYTAPAAAGNHTVTAAANADPAVSASVAVTVLPSTATSVTVTITPTTASVAPGAQQAFQATVTGANDTSVQWSVDGVAGGNANAGTITSAGVYTAPGAAGNHTVTATSNAQPAASASAAVSVSATQGPPPPPAPGAVLTFRYTNDRMGLNDHETTLTPANVSTSFGKLFAQKVDANVFAQPLYVPNLSIPNKGTHNVVFVATEHDSVYAFDADSYQAPLWKTTFLINGATAVPTQNVNNVSTGRTGLGPEVGITGTPVIDLNTNTLYVSAMTWENSKAVHRLHALDITTGAEKPGSPVVITATVPGTGVGSDGNGHITFYPDTQNQRAGLLLQNGLLYIAFGSFSDVEPYHGWVFAYDAQTLQQAGVFITSPTGEGGSIWQGASGPAADAQGNIYISTADGTFDANNGGPNYGDSLMKLQFANGVFNVLDWFTPFNQNCLNGDDLDLGAGGPVLLPDSLSTRQIVVVPSKEGRFYVVDRNLMGHYRSNDDSQILDEVLINSVACTGGSNPNLQADGYTTNRIYGAMAYWNGNIYVGPANTTLRRYTIDMNGQVNLASQTSYTFQTRGSAPIITSNGNSNAILWVDEHMKENAAKQTNIAILRAYDAMDLSKQLYASTSTADTIGDGRGVVFAIPTVINGKVYVGSENYLTVFGLK